MSIRHRGMLMRGKIFLTYLVLFFVTNAWAASNFPPTANSQTVSTNEDATLLITLTGSDPDGDALTYAIGKAPGKGTLTCSGPQCVYVPIANINGTDLFTFQVSDGSLTSRAATVRITINAVNDAPTVEDMAMTFNEDYTATIRPTANDIENDRLTLRILTNGWLGTASVNSSGDAILYTPTANANGNDSFTFTASDGKAASNPGTVTLTINPVNDAPTATDQTLTTSEDTPASLNLAVTDIDGDALTVTPAFTPIYGSLSVSGTTILYTPNANVSGSDTFAYYVSDGVAKSATATVSITVNPVNDPPTVDDASLEVSAGETTILTLTGDDTEGSALSFSLISAPAHGTAKIVDSSLTFTADSGYIGKDSLLFVATDGETQSNPGAVNINIVGFDAVKPIAIGDLEPIDTAKITVGSDKIIVTLATGDLYEFSATPLVLPIELDDGQIVEAAYATLHARGGAYVTVEHYAFLLRTDNGQAYRFISERESGGEPDGTTTAFYDGPTGLLVTPLTATALGTQDDPEEPTGRLMLQQNGETEYLNYFMGQSITASVLSVDGIIPVSTDNNILPTCQTHAKIGSEYCGVWGFIVAQTGELLDMAFYDDNGYEAWYSAAQTRTVIKDRDGNVTYDRLAWGTGPGGNNWDDLDVGGACSAFLVDKENILDAVLDGLFADFDLFAQDLKIGAKSYDPGDAGCVGSGNYLSAIQGEITVGFNPATKLPTYWLKGYQPDEFGSKQTRITQLDENFEHVCDVMVDSGLEFNPFNGPHTGMTVASDGTAFTNANYHDGSGIKRTAILAIEPTSCATTTLVELNASALGESGIFSGVTLAVDAQGHNVVLAAIAGGSASDNGKLYAMSNGNVTTYSLGSSGMDKIIAAPVIDSNGRVIVISSKNTATILPLSLSYGDHPWPRFRKDNFGTATVEMILSTD